MDIAIRAVKRVEERCRMEEEVGMKEKKETLRAAAEALCSAVANYRNAVQSAQLATMDIFGGVLSPSSADEAAISAAVTVMRAALLTPAPGEPDYEKAARAIYDERDHGKLSSMSGAMDVVLAVDAALESALSTPTAEPVDEYTKAAVAYCEQRSQVPADMYEEPLKWKRFLEARAALGRSGR